VCAECEAGKYKETLENAPCVSCLSAHYSPAGSSRSTDCVTGSVVIANAMQCAPTFILDGDQCFCAPGFDAQPGPETTASMVCTACVPGKYKETLGNELCTHCPGSQYSPEGSTLTTDCVNYASMNTKQTVFVVPLTTIESASFAEEVNTFRADIADAANVAFSKVTIVPTVVYEVQLSNADAISFTPDNQITFREAIALESAVEPSQVTIVPKVAVEVRLVTDDFSLNDQKKFREALAAAANVDVSRVEITSIETISGESTQRRLLQASVQVNAVILPSDTVVADAVADAVNLVVDEDDIATELSSAGLAVSEVSAPEMVMTVVIQTADTPAADVASSVTASTVEQTLLAEGITTTVSTPEVQIVIQIETSDIEISDSSEGIETAGSGQQTAVLTANVVTEKINIAVDVSPSTSRRTTQSSSTTSGVQCATGSYNTPLTATGCTELPLYAVVNTERTNFTCPPDFTRAWIEELTDVDLPQSFDNVFVTRENCACSPGKEPRNTKQYIEFGYDRIRRSSDESSPMITKMRDTVSVWDVTVRQDMYNVDILIVAGGGAGAHTYAGGGGAGGIVWLYGVDLRAGEYEIQVGVGGAGATNEQGRGGSGETSHLKMRSAGRRAFAWTSSLQALGGGAGGGGGDFRTTLKNRCEDVITCGEDYDHYGGESLNSPCELCEWPPNPHHTELAGCNLGQSSCPKSLNGGAAVDGGSGGGSGFSAFLSDLGKDGAHGLQPGTAQTFDGETCTSGYSGLCGVKGKMLQYGSRGGSGWKR